MDGDAERLTRKCLTGECTLRKNSSGKSLVWEKFGEIIDQNGDRVPNYVACVKCKKAYAYSGHKTGTSSLLRHKCTSGTSTILRYTQSTVTKPVTNDAKDMVCRRAVEFVAKDIRPFQVVAGAGFLNMAQTLIGIGAKYGNVDASSLLPHPTTLSRKTSELAEELRDVVRDIVVPIARSIGISATLDLWTDDHKKVSYLGVTIHYVRDYKLVGRVLCTSEFDPECRKTGENVRAALQQALRRYGLHDCMSNIVFVTDRGSNMIAALKTSCRLNCSAHSLNTILEHTMRAVRVDSDSDNSSSDFSGVLEACRSLVTFFKRSGLQCRLQQSLKGDVETRWNSKLELFSSILSQWESIEEILRERNELFRLDTISRRSLEILVGFLTPFKKASDELESSTRPTLHLVPVWKRRLLQHCVVEARDCHSLRLIKENSSRLIEEKLELHQLHKVAMFLHPRLKGLKALEDDRERCSVHNEVRRMAMERLSLRDTTQSADDDAGPSDAPPKKKARSARNTVAFLSDFEDSDDDEPSEVDEVARYIELKVKDTNEDLLGWWKQHETVFPDLCALAKFVHCIPASSAPSERDFSLAGLVLQSRRTNLSPSSVDNILFLHSNLDKE